jgi:hypothetical protein
MNANLSAKHDEFFDVDVSEESRYEDPSFLPGCGFCFPSSIEGVSKNMGRHLHPVVSTSAGRSGLLARTECARWTVIPQLAVWDATPDAEVIRSGPCRVSLRTPFEAEPVSEAELWFLPGPAEDLDWDPRTPPLSWRIGAGRLFRRRGRICLRR